MEELTRLLWKTHRLDPAHHQEFLESVTDTERHASSYLGDGLSIPHGELVDANRIVGVMGVSRDGIPSEEDGQRIHCIVLLATPSTQRDRHLEVLAAFARAIGQDRNIRHQLYDARSPAHAYLLLHAEDAEDFNYFLDVPADARPA